MQSVKLDAASRDIDFPAGKCLTVDVQHLLDRGKLYAEIFIALLRGLLYLICYLVHGEPPSIHIIQKSP